LTETQPISIDIPTLLMDRENVWRNNFQPANIRTTVTPQVNLDFQGFSWPNAAGFAVP